ncbi:MAG: protein-L-isoaspartate O-methyltransferase [Patescibacteria group bacterium]
MNNSDLVEKLKTDGFLKTPAIISAFQKIDRADFVLPQYSNEPYEDYPLPIGHGQTISQPATVAFMLELLQPKNGEKILDMGAGSGWTTALLAEIAGDNGSVFGLEIIPELVEFGKNNLGKYNFKNAEILLAGRPAATLAPAGEKLGLPSKAPFDKILVSAAAEEIPQELTAQLKIGGGGIMVVPIKNSIFKITRITKDKFQAEEFSGFVFVPLIH